MFRSGVLVSLLAFATQADAAVVVDDHSSLRKKQKFRMCNAYPSEYPITAKLNKEEITTSGSLAYKKCAEFSLDLKVGDKLDFNVGKTYAGAFAIDELPSSSAVMLLVIHRHDTMSTAVSFQSHVFGTMENAQLAVIDTYRGKMESQTGVREVVKSSKKAKDLEVLKDAVVALRPGKYEVALMDAKTKDPKVSDPLLAVSGESYVALRVGIEAEDKNGVAYPEDIVVFPQSSAAALRPALLVAALLFFFMN
eukprot:TRINITY_DN4851_c2_g1_i2.p1 TRINITY_DN4851_c2_g1~~TRINITY_DN4851_c2_g1_i2.p1  ORF type:complete len:251 (+),score=72.03 TRINITY_DN4851_c2_g1_i2:90-842(+)